MCLNNYNKFDMLIRVGTCLLVLMLVTKVAQSENIVRLSAKPLRCVALREGQICYQHVTFHWQSKLAGDYCLYQESSDIVLQCWQNAKEGKYKLDFQSPVTLGFVLKDKQSTIVLADIKITVAWVYKSSKRPRINWRLF